MSRPVRTCTGCRGRDEKAELVRLVMSGGAVVVDVSQTLPGRGAYLHRSSHCGDRAVRRRTIGRALRAAVDARQVEDAVRNAVGALA